MTADGPGPPPGRALPAAPAGAQPRLACLRFPHLALVRAWRVHPELRDEAVVVFGPGPGGQPVVTAASAAAQAAGVTRGQPLGQAEAACPGAARLPQDLLGMAELRRAALTALADCSPLVEWTDDATVHLDGTGRHLRHPDEASWAAACGRQLDAQLGVPPAVGVGESRFTAHAAATAAGPGRVRRVAPGKAAAFLAPVAVAELPISAEARDRLCAFGLHTCGDCAAVPAADLQRQLGPEGLFVHRLACGRDLAQLRPWREPPVFGVRLVLAGTVVDREALRFVAPRLAEAVAGRLREAGRAAGRLRLVLRAQDDPDAPVAAGPPYTGCWWGERIPPQPVATAAELLPVVLGLIGSALPEEPVLVLELCALELQPIPTRQVDLWHRHDADREAIAQAAARLHDRFGPGLVWQVRLREGAPDDLPERRLAWAPG
ncbi:MAG TPA: hypothetical protein VNN74_06950 [Candidatus Micrarchaeia archaeon]|nr:hypothetical protein [Candidatus Micrarchaeia archaeon]